MSGRTATALTALLILGLSAPPGSACAAAPANPPATRPTTVPATKPATRQTVEQKTRALHDAWRDRLEAERFNAVEAGPFLIAGNGTPAQLAAYRDGTILAAEASLRTMYFAKPLEEPVLILLFETEGPYKRLAKKWFDEADVPHFGFYRPWDRCMLMNVGTGTGTLVHELVHALIAPDFPAVPDWFNEGLASLYEQSQIAQDKRSITGLVNWRLPALQKAIADGTLRPIAEMAADDDFRNAERTGLNYAHARYVMLYLQEKGLLRRYYSAFRDAHKDDPDGMKTLRKVVGEDKPFEQWEREWKAWVMTLGAGR
jgi:hypothetical protein